MAEVKSVCSFKIRMASSTKAKKVSGTTVQNLEQGSMDIKLPTQDATETIFKENAAQSRLTAKIVAEELAARVNNSLKY